MPKRLEGKDSQGQKTLSCSTCRKLKPYDQFNKNKSTTHGVGYTCRPCEKERHYRLYGTKAHRRESVAKGKGRKTKGKRKTKRKPNGTAKRYQRRTTDNGTADLRERILSVIVPTILDVIAEEMESKDKAFRQQISALVLDA